MRRFIVLPLALILVVALAAPVAAGANVTNQSGTFDQAYGSWAYDDGAGTSTYGEFFIVQEAGRGGFVEYLYEESGRYVDCSAKSPRGGISPKDTTGGGYGFQGTRTFGSGDASLTIGRRLSGATASGTIHVETTTVDDCAGTYDVTSAGNETLSVALAGSGPVISFKGTSSVKIPGELKGHSSYSGEQRAASGTVAFGRGDRTVDAQIAHVTWKDHCSGTC